MSPHGVMRGLLFGLLFSVPCWIGVIALAMFVWRGCR